MHEKKNITRTRTHGRWYAPVALLLAVLLLVSIMPISSEDFGYSQDGEIPVEIPEPSEEAVEVIPEQVYSEEPAEEPAAEEPAPEPEPVESELAVEEPVAEEVQTEEIPVEVPAEESADEPIAEPSDEEAPAEEVPADEIPEEESAPAEEEQVVPEEPVEEEDSEADETAPEIEEPVIADPVVYIWENLDDEAFVSWVMDGQYDEYIVLMYQAGGEEWNAFLERIDLIEDEVIRSNVSLFVDNLIAPQETVEEEPAEDAETEDEIKPDELPLEEVDPSEAYFWNAFEEDVFIDWIICSENDEFIEDLYKSEDERKVAEKTAFDARIDAIADEEAKAKVRTYIEEILAEKPAEEEKEFYYVVFENPLTAGDPQYTDFDAQQMSEEIYDGMRFFAADTEYVSYDELLQFIRVSMVNRNASVTVYYEHPAVVEGYSQFLTIARQIFNDALAHTGVGNEGDYLRWHYAGYGVGGSVEGKTDSTTKFKFNFRFTYYTTAAEEAQVTQYVNNILAGLPDGDTYTKIKYLYDSVTCCTSYGKCSCGNNHCFTAYGAGIEHVSVCQGITNLMYRMLNDAGIDARFVSSIASECHSYNIVNIDGTYYYLDATWDLGGTNNSYSYFLRGSTRFSKDHTDGSDFVSSYNISATDYVHRVTTGYLGTNVRWCFSNGVLTFEPVDRSQESSMDNDTSDAGYRSFLKALPSFEDEITTTVIDSVGSYGGLSEADIYKGPFPSSCVDPYTGYSGSKSVTVPCFWTDENLAKLGLASNPKVSVVRSHEFTESDQHTATCTSDGVKLLVCTGCGATQETDTVVSALGHDWVLSKHVDSTCTTQGYDLYKCSRCGSEKKDMLDLIDHDYQLSEHKDPTCHEQGYDKYVCTMCGEANYEYIDKTSHNWVEDSRVEPTCSKEGKIVYKCTICGDTKEEKLEKVDHEWEYSRRVEPDCHKEGADIYVCKYCGAEKSTPIAKTTHEFEETSRIEPTCQKQGLITYTCKHCGDTKTEAIQKVDHNYEFVKRVEPTCHENGYILSKCTMCGDEHKEDLGRTEHNWEQTGREEPTCVKKGKLIFTCSICGDTRTEDIDTIDHDYVLDQTIEATCHEDGKYIYKCSMCGDTKEEAIPMLEHVWEETERVEATCTVDGKVTYTCKLCGDTKEENIPAKGHVPDDMPATETTVGGVRCSVCGEILEEPKNGIQIPLPGVTEGTTVHINGIPYTAGDEMVVVPASLRGITSAAIYSYSQGSGDPYPSGMTVWILHQDETTGVVTSERADYFDNLLNYRGTAIRLTGNQGIRVKTGIAEGTRSALVSGNYNGYSVQEYGTIVSWADSNSNPTYGGSGVMAGRAYVRGSLDSTIEMKSGYRVYANVLVFKDDMSKTVRNLAIRPYIIVADSEGNEFTIYGGVLTRSIYSVALQAQNAFAEGTGGWKFIHNIIQYHDSLT